MNKPTRFFILAQLLITATVAQAKPTSIVVSEEQASPIDRVAKLRANILKVEQAELNPVVVPRTLEIAQWPNWGNWGNYWNNWRNY
jgi:hypothetical protein